MGTLLFAAIAKTAGGGVAWQALAGALGAYFVDSRLQRRNFEPQKLDGLQLQSGTEGQGMWCCDGQENRVSGQVIWASPRRDVVHSGGKGPGAPDTLESTISFALSFGEAPRGGVHTIDKVWLQGKLFYDDTPGESVSSNLISLVRTAVVTPYIDTGALGGSGPTVTVFYADIRSPAGGPDLTRFRSGVNATITGFANANNNGTFRVVHAKKIDAAGTTEMRVQNTNCVAASASPTIGISQTVPKWSGADDVRVYTGSETQNPDPLMESFEGGAGSVPAYRGQCYVVVENLDLAPYGGVFPLAAEGMVTMTSAPDTVADAIVRRVVRAGRSADDVDVTAVAGLTLKGHATRGPTDTIEALRPILLAYDLLTQEDNGVLRFFPREDADVVEVAAESVVEPPDGGRRRVRIEDGFSGLVPTRVELTYIDPAADYQVGSTSAKLPDPGAITDKVETVHVPVVMPGDDANALAKRILWTLVVAQRGMHLWLPPSMLALAEADVLRLLDWKGISQIDCLTSTVDVGANWLLEVQGPLNEAQTAVQVGESEPGGAESGDRNTVFVAPETILVPLPIGPMRDEDVERPGFPWGGCYADPAEAFVGARLFESRDDGVTYEDVQQMQYEATIGNATTALATGKVGLWDGKNTVTVRLANGSLSSCTELECLNGANRALLGGEVIGFMTATATGVDTYVLSGLLRGLVDTRHAVGLHAIGDTFILLNAAALNFRDLAVSDFGLDLDYKLVSQNGVLTDFNAQQWPIRLPTLRHFAPCSLLGARNDANANILISWVRCARRPFRVLSQVPPPLDDSQEQYVLEILNDAETNVVRSVTVTGASQYTYLAADQTTDGFTAGAKRHVRVFQVSSIVGRSYPSAATIV